MDKDLVRQSLSYHGPTLLSLLRCEQHEHAAPPPGKERNVNNVEIQHFIARKADLLFSLSWKSNTPENADSLEPSQGYSAVMPPLEQFMDVPNEEKKELFFRDVERGDVVIGKISSIRDFGFFVVLLAMGSGILRDITTLEINALCPVRDVPSQSSHGDPLSYYQIGDPIQAAVKDIDRYHEKLTLSLHKSALPTHMSSVKLGVITTDDMPDYYKENFSDQDFAASLRKKQSSSWALKCVKLGVDYFKVGRHVDAMNEYNKALEIDAQNVEALVARGALYATKGSLNKAIHDFEVALENCPTHRNARKYLCQTLVERGGQLEEEDKLLNAESYYSKALTIDKTFTEAEEALNKLRLCKQVILYILFICSIRKYYCNM
uniref:Tetratricopeptide repeat domain 14 n=1 Tax=Leptobrachium leishanense TaxID=445787 RepID=A0A8C5R1D3_9ANUR